MRFIEKRVIPYNQANNRFSFSGNLVFSRAFHIGSGWGNEFTDSTVVRNSKGKPIIPGSSFKGVFRSSIERLLMSISEELWACQLYEEKEFPDNKLCLGNQIHLKKHKEKTSNLNFPNEEIPFSELENKLCDSCKLFGAGSYWASKIKFCDLPLIPKNNESKNIIEIRHGVGIHRRTGTAADGVKYDQEIVTDGSSFKFEAFADNLSAVDFQLLSIGLHLLLNGEMLIGASTTRGLGTCQLTNFSIGFVDFLDKEQTKNYLLNKSYNLVESPETEIQKYLN
ncbi:MAG: CRISPR-associated RAMP protein [Anaerolineaceae bacterium]|nr:CRISPR-associated RAMP protein [Anaerolineaceae bacterium]